jgi:hypothetical protein
MFTVKRALRIGIPVTSLLLGVTLYADSRSNDCAHLSVVAKVMRFAGMGQIQPCAIERFNDTDICAEIGHHCNVGNGPGKCRNVADPDTAIVSCQCISK